MNLLKKDYWWIWLLLFIFAGNVYIFLLGALLNVYDKKAWYANINYWIIGILLFFFPAMIMLTVFSIQIMALTAAKLKVEGKELYLSPYVWIILAIIPIFGWISLAVLSLYLQIMIIINLKEGYGEKYI